MISHSAQTPDETGDLSHPSASALMMQRCLRGLLRVVLVLVVLLFLLIAIVSALLGFGSPYLGRYHSEIQARVSDYLGAPVVLGSMQMDWSLTGPGIAVDDVTVLAADGSADSAVEFDQMQLELSLAKTLITGGWHFNQLAVVGADLVVEYHGESDIRVKGIKQGVADKSDNRQRSNSASGPSMAWLFRMSKAALLESALTVVDVAHDKTYRFESIDVEAENNGDRHELAASIRLPESLGD